MQKFKSSILSCFQWIKKQWIEIVIESPRVVSEVRESTRVVSKNSEQKKETKPSVGLLIDQSSDQKNKSSLNLDLKVKKIRQKE